MEYQKILLENIDSRFKDSSLYLRTYVSCDTPNVTSRPFLLILPGGGYEYCSESEAEPVACRFLAEGFNCAILDYSTYEKYPLPHLDVTLAMSYIRKHQRELKIDKNFIAILGFSAGGHLAASYGYLYKEAADKLGIKENVKPDALILAYPVLSTEDETHQTTKDIITNGEPDLIRKLHVFDHVDKEYPPTFIWTTKEDIDVPPSNTTRMVEQLKKNNVLFECSIFEHGYHGTSIYTRGCRKKEEMIPSMEPIKDWPRLASNFILKLFDNKK